MSETCWKHLIFGYRHFLRITLHPIAWILNLEGQSCNLGQKILKFWICSEHKWKQSTASSASHSPWSNYVKET